MIINQLPAEVISVLSENAESAWEWFSEQFYVAQRAQQADHLLVRIGQHFDLHAVEQACAGYHVHSGGRGQEAVHPVRHLCRALLVKHLYGWSYRETVRQIGADLVVRGFVGYGLHARPLSYGTLYHFARWFRQAGHDRTLFTTILRRLDAMYPAEARAVRSPQSRTAMLRDASRRLLQALAVASPVAHASVQGRYNAEALFGPATEKAEFALTKAERYQREEQTARVAHGLQRAVQQATQPLATYRAIEVLACQRWLGLLHKILHDEFLFTLDDQGQATAAKLREKHEPSAFVIGSTLDTEATFRKHGDKCQLGYNVNVAATPTFIREIYAVTGATPNGQLSTTAFRVNRQDAQGWSFRFTATQCQGCPLIARCRQAYAQTAADAQALAEQAADSAPQAPSPQKGRPKKTAAPAADGIVKGHRTVFLSDYLYQQNAAVAYTRTDDFADDMKLRPHIERIIAGLTRYNDARRAHGAGLRNADFQARMYAAGWPPLPTISSAGTSSFSTRSVAPVSASSNSSRRTMLPLTSSPWRPRGRIVGAPQVQRQPAVLARREHENNRCKHGVSCFPLTISGTGSGGGEMSLTIKPA
ncbi:MAG: transposase [Caldilineaceae bacterium]